MSKKKNPYEYVDGLEKGKPFAIVPEKQTKSRAFMNLSGDAVKLLVYLKQSRRYYTGKDKNGESKTINGDPLCFYWNRELAERNGFNNPNKTLRSMRELVQNGFVEVIENNANRRTKNIFRFSWKWQTIEEGNDIELSDASRTYLKPKKCTQKPKQS